MFNIRVFTLILILATALPCAFTDEAPKPPADSAELLIDLQAQDAVNDWKFLDPKARIEGGELVFDGRQKISRAVYTPHEWADVKLQAKFLVEPQTEGVLACGFMVRAVDASSYYYVHFDRNCFSRKFIRSLCWTSNPFATCRRSH